jgi:hypothetical protein
MDIVDKILFVVEHILDYFGQGDVIKDYREKRDNEKKNNQFFSEIASFYTQKLDLNFNVIKSDERFARSNAYQYWVDRQFNDMTPLQKNALVLFGLCNEYLDSRSAETYGAIKRYMDTFEISFSSISPDVKMLLDGYDKLFHTTEKIALGSLFSSRGADYNTLLKEFADKYSKELAFRYISDMLSQSEELRDTLVTLINDGALATYGLNRKTLEVLENELRIKANYAKTFVIIANKVPKSIKEYIQKQPRIGTAAYVSNMPNQKESHKFSVYVIRPEDGFKNSAELLHKFKALSKGLREEMMIQILPIDGTNVVNYNFPANQSFENERLRHAYELSSYFKGGTKYSDADIWNILAKSEMGIKDILALIPFNILVPGIFPSEKEFIIRNYPEIQRKVGVTTLVDWADKSPKLVEKVLGGCGKINYNVEETKAAIGENRLQKISEDIVYNSGKLKTSLGLLD